MPFKILFLTLLLAIASTAASAGCFESAGERYDISPELLRAIARTESGMNPLAMNRNPNGTADIGMMQINTGWLPLLKKYGIGMSNLWGACTNVMVGAWVLKRNIIEHGYSWKAVGAYNAKTPSKRDVYARKVYAQLLRKTR